MFCHAFEIVYFIREKERENQWKLRIDLSIDFIQYN